VTDPVTGQGGFLADPGAVIAGIVHDAEPSLDRDVIAAAITRAAPSRAQQRRLAAALSDDPGLLTSGRPEGPPQVELLIRDLQRAGARQLVLPRCAHCGEPRRLVQCDGRLRICSACDRRRRGAAEPCSVCGSARQVAARDQHGRPRRTRCRPYPVAGITAHVSGRDPGPVRAGLEDVITSAIPSPFQRHQVLWELDARPALLAGEGAHGSPRVNVLIRALVNAGVPGIVAPACPSCGQAVPLRFRLGEVRCCRRCYDRDRLETCSRCGRAGDIASRTAAGDPVCSECFRRDPANHGQCSNCGRTALTVRRDDGDRLVPPLLPGAGRHLLALRPGQALLPGRRRHPALRALLTPDAPRPVRPLRHQPGRMDAHRRRPAAMRFLQPAAGAVQYVRQDPYRRRPASRGTLVQHVLPQGPGIVAALHRLRGHRASLPSRIVHPLRLPRAPARPAVP
jgi:hypothetical protein